MSERSERPTLFIGGPEDGKVRVIRAYPWDSYHVLEFGDALVLWEDTVDVPVQSPAKHMYMLRPLQGNSERWFLAMHESLSEDEAIGMVLGAYSKQRLRGEPKL